MTTKSILRKWKLQILLALGLLPLLAWGCSGIADAPTTAPSLRAEPVAPTSLPSPYDAGAVARIRDEALNRSQVMATLSYLSDVIGPRLTGSPNLHRANEWTRDKLTEWGLSNSHLEAWGPFGRGWSIKRFSAEVIEPQAIPLIAYPRAWSPGFDQPLEAEVILLDPKSMDELQSFEGKLEGKIVLLGGERPVRAHFTADATRLTDDELSALARGQRGRGPTTTELVQSRGRRGGQNAARGLPTSNPAVAAVLANQVFNFAARQKASLLCSPSTIGDDGTVFVQSANGVGGGARGPTTSVYAAEPPQVPPQITLATEQYNRIVRMIRAGEKVKMAVNMQVQFYNDDLMAYNTIAEIPGTDLADQIVMLGGHMDSWHTGTGATDNGAGVSCAMEAVRIIKALNLKPRRTIRIALWTGEEEGLYGSAAYVKQHFGSAQGGGGLGGAIGAAFGGGGRAGPITKGPEYDKLSVYFNLDNGTGRVRGVYAQGNTNAMPIFQAWLAPFADLDAKTVTPNNTTGTDHLSFDRIGLPGFQFIQDVIDYNARTHHSNMDVFDRIQGDDMRQASAIMATFVYNAAMMDQRFPRK